MTTTIVRMSQGRRSRRFSTEDASPGSVRTVSLETIRVFADPGDDQASAVDAADDRGDVSPQDGDPQKLAQSLVKEANLAGGEGNVSAIAVRVQ